MKISKQSRRDAKELFRSCVANGQLDEGRVRQAVQAVISGKPRGYVALLSHFQRLVKLELERHRARIESAVPLSNEERTTLAGNLAWKYGQGLDVSFAENPTLIGGLRIQVGSDVYDGSVRGRLDALRESF